MKNKILDKCTIDKICVILDKELEETPVQRICRELVQHGINADTFDSWKRGREALTYPNNIILGIQNMLINHELGLRVFKTY